MSEAIQANIDLWGARARDWAEVEDEGSRALFETVLDTVDVEKGTRLLDVGCGAAGLEPESIADLDWTWQYSDRETALRGWLSPGPSTLAIQASGEEAVREALASALEQFRLTDGGYRLENTVHCLIARA